MAKKRTGLQSQIASIFSGVPVPKKGGASAESPSAASPPAAPERPQPKAPPVPGSVLPRTQPPVEPVREMPPARVTPPRIPEPKVGQIPAVPRRKKERIVAPRPGVSSARQKVAVGMVVFLSILLVFLLVRPFQRRPSRPAASGLAGQAKAGVSPKANIKIDWPIPQRYPEDLRDPMLLGATQEVVTKTSDALVVRGITHSADRKFAVIGTETFKEGDTVQGATIIKINPNSVEFEKDGETWTQPVQSEGN